jgi:hypothetical protein
MTEIPRYESRFQMNAMPMVQYSTAGARQLQSASAELGAFAQGMNQQAEKVERLRAQATMRENMHRISRENSSDPAALQANLEGFKKEFIPNLPGNLQSEFEQLYRLESIGHVDMASNKYNDKLRADTQVEGMRNFSAITNNLQTATRLYETAQTPEARQAASDMMQSSLKDAQGVADLTDQEGMPMFSPAQRVAMGSEAIASPIKALSAKGQMMALNPPVGFEANLPIIKGFEGADQIVPNPDGISQETGQMTYAWRGINSEANPVAFAQIQDLVAKGDIQGASNIAIATYKKKYWEDVGIDSLPARYQAIVFDAAVNQGEGYAKQLINEINKGATPSQILEMREDRYRTTKGTPQERISWANRLRALTPIALGENADLLDPDMKATLERGVQQSIEREQQLKQKDYAAWAQFNGKTADEAVAEAGGSRFVPVLANEQAQTLATQLSQAEDPKVFTEMGLALQQQFPKHMENAIGDLEKAKAPSELTAALRLIAKDPVGYQKQIQTLHAASKINDEEINLGLKNIGKDPTDISANVAKAYLNDDFTDIEAFELTKNNLAPYQLNKQAMLTKFAKVYMFNNPSASVDDAIQAGMAPYTDGYKIGKVNAYKFKIPSTSNAEALEQSMNEFYRYEVRKAVAEPTKQYELANNMIPVLADDNETYYFVDATGEGIKVGDSPLSVTITDLKQMQTLDEKRAQLEGLPYMQREAARRELFGIDVKEIEQAKERKALVEKMKKPVGYVEKAAK